MKWLQFLLIVLLALPGFARPAPMELFDAHIHYSADAWGAYPVAEVLAILDRAGIRRALVSSTPDDGTLKLYEAAPGRIVPELRPYRSPSDMGTWHRDESLIPYLEQRLRRGIYRGIGEFHLSAADAGSPVVRRVVQLAVARGLVLHVHGDARTVEKLTDLDPKVRILWAHAGMSDPPEIVERLLERSPNLWAELSYRLDEVAPGGRLDPLWRGLFLRFPDRFMYGSDTWAPARWPEVPGVAQSARKWLEQLPPDLAEGIAWRNAEALFGE
ncbi:MAG TPA: amidohydrolase family protein [Burkholderiales bacterium]|nr:amidohydrolase family protein [Burkholderiales bacterium]